MIYMPAASLKRTGMRTSSQMAQLLIPGKRQRHSLQRSLQEDRCRTALQAMKRLAAARSLTRTERSKIESGVLRRTWVTFCNFMCVFLRPAFQKGTKNHG